MRTNNILMLMITTPVTVTAVAYIYLTASIIYKLGYSHFVCQTILHFVREKPDSQLIAMTLSISTDSCTLWKIV